MPSTVPASLSHCSPPNQMTDVGLGRKAEMSPLDENIRLSLLRKLFRVVKVEEKVSLGPLQPPAVLRLESGFL